MSIRNRARALAGLARARRVEVDGVPLTIPPGVLDPVLFRSGAWFARQVARRVEPGWRVLDMGTGSGVVGLLAQRAGGRVVAVDLGDAAVAAARANGLTDVRQGDLFEPVGDEAFDLVSFNPPYLPGAPRGRLGRQRSLSMALHGGEELEVVRRFGAEVDAHLRPGGTALICWSDRAPLMVRKVVGRDWRKVASAVIEAEMLSTWEHAAP